MTEREISLMAHFLDHWQPYAREENESLTQMVTGDKTWCHHFELESKQQSLQWRYRKSSPPRKCNAIHTSSGKVKLWCLSLTKTVPSWETSCSTNQYRIPSVTRKSWRVFVKRSNENDQASLHLGSYCSTTMQSLIRPRRLRHSYRNWSGRRGPRSPSIQFRTLSPRLFHSCFLKKISEGKNHLRWRNQALRAELVHIALSGSLRDIYPPPCVSSKLSDFNSQGQHFWNTSTYVRSYISGSLL